MAGVKGRSGGPRKNAGGKRPGAGRPPKGKTKPKAKRARARAALPEMTPAQEAALGSRLPPAPGFIPPAPPPPSSQTPPADNEDLNLFATGIKDAKEFLEGVISGIVVATADQIRAAQALLPFQHQKLGEAGKKDQRKDEAAKVAGRFAPAPPRLAAVAGKKV